MELMNDLADKMGFLSIVSRSGIRDFQLNPRHLSHEHEIVNSRKFDVCINGSDNFFMNSSRSELLIERLNSGKSINVLCHKNNVDKIKKVRSDFESSGADISNFNISCHQYVLMYNFLDVDEGTWIKTYFVHRRDLMYAAPAFFVSCGTELWGRYQRDVQSIRDGAEPA